MSLEPVWRSQLAAWIPEGWQVRESLTLLAPEGHANVIFSSEPLDAGVDIWQYADVAGERIRHEFPGFRELGYGPATVLGNRTGIVRRFRWQPPGGAQTVQFQLYCVEGGRGFTATATTAATDLHEVGALLDQVLLGLRRTTR